MELSYKSNRREKTHVINYLDDVTETKYFSPDLSDNDAAKDGDPKSSADEAEQLSFVAFRIKKTRKNGLAAFSNVYSPGYDDHDSLRNFVVVEFRSDIDCRQFVRSTPAELLTMFDGSDLRPLQVQQYAESLVADSKKENRRYRRTPGSSKRDAFLKGMRDDDILMVYPFPADKVAMEYTTNGLLELSGASLTQSNDDDTDVEVIETKAPESGDEDKGELGEMKASEKRGRAHYLTVRVEDFERLECGEFLNDTLIDLFMQW